MGTCGNGIREVSRNPGLAQQAVPRTGSQGDAESHFPVCGILGSAYSKKSSWGRPASEPQRAQAPGDAAGMPALPSSSMTKSKPSGFARSVSSALKEGV